MKIIIDVQKDFIDKMNSIEDDRELTWSQLLTVYRRLHAMLDSGTPLPERHDDVPTIIEAVSNNAITISEGETNGNVIKIPPNATNGDVITALFSNYESRYDTEYEIITGHLDKTHRHNFDLSWWNAPYKERERCRNV